MLVGSLGAGGCDDGASSAEGGDQLEARLSVIQAEIFTPKCSLASCHTMSFHSGELVLEDGSSHAALTEGATFQTNAAAEGLARIVPGDAASSFLWIKLQPDLNADYGTLMPQGSTEGLPEDELSAIERWIEAGAPND